MKICIGKNDKNNNPIFIGDTIKTDEAGWVGKVTVVILDEFGGFSLEPNWDKCEIVEEGI